jgi:lysophospholipase L1-like esterase
MNQTAPQLAAAFAWHHLDATVINESYGGTGLLDPHMVSTQIATINAQRRADIIVIEFSGNCFSCSVTYGSPEFFEEWSTNLVTIVHYVQSQGKHAVVVLPPPLRPDVASAGVELQLGIQDRADAVETGATLANWSDALVDSDGNYQQVLNYADVFADPAPHTVRNDDGVHLTVDGARRTAEWTVAALRPFWASSG